LRVVHKKEVYQADNPLFMLKSNGEFVFLAADRNISQYNGMFLKKEFDMYKLLEDIRLIKCDSATLTYNLHSYARTYSELPTKECFKFDENGLLYEVNNFLGDGKITLDMRHIYDFSSEGRIYKTYTKDGALVIEYIKYNDNSLRNESYRLYIVVRGLNQFDLEGGWSERYYRFDDRRGTPSKAYVYDLLTFNINGKIKLRISGGFSEEEALKKSSKSFIEKKVNKEKDSALACMIKSMNGFIQKDGIYAGLPWFYQYWTRDEAICLKCLPIIGKKKEAKEILSRQINNILEDGRIPNRYPYSQLGSADGVGWVWKRINDIFSSSEKKKVMSKLALSIERLEKNYFNDNLICNKAKETWMDTQNENDTRDGARIEIQALMLNMYSMIDKKKEIVMKKKVREVFFDGQKLADGKDDFTQRPNIFLAYYIYPNLLSKQEWKIVFNYALERLWLDWGGLATIDKKHKLFQPYYTGQNNHSYHRGDSWYFVNHLAAISMFLLDKKYYKEKINAIISGSKKEILTKGIIGECAEISSASKQLSEGCLAQAWSAATFIEMMSLIQK